MRAVNRWRYRLGRHVRQNPGRLLAHMVDAGLEVRSVIHCGAHLAQERGFYENLGARDVLWVEGSPAIHARLEQSLASDKKAGLLAARHVAVNGLLFETSGRPLRLHGFTNDGQSNSIFHATEAFRKRWAKIDETGQAEEVISTTLDDLVEELTCPSADLLVLDLQGAELSVLRGGGATLAKAVAVICETSKLPIYEGGARYEEVVAFMRKAGFLDMHRAHTVGDVLSS